MLPKKERLNRAAFNRFFAAGKRIHSPHLQIVWAQHPTFHASVVVPKKIEKSAVGRNRIRRRIYAILSRYKHEVGVKGVYIVLVKPGVATLSHAALTEEIIRSLTPPGTAK